MFCLSFAAAEQAEGGLYDNYFVPELPTAAATKIISNRYAKVKRHEWTDVEELFGD
jgi:hypothetical protein